VQSEIKEELSPPDAHEKLALNGEFKLRHRHHGCR